MERVYGASVWSKCMERYRGLVMALSFIFNTRFPGGDSPVLSAVIAN